MSQNIVEKIKSIEWHSDWSGESPLLDVSNANEIYYKGFKANFKKPLRNLLVTFKNGIASGKMAQDEYEEFGSMLAIKMSDIEFVRDFVTKYEKISDEILKKSNVDPEEFLKNLAGMKTLLGNYGAYHEAIKIAFNFLGEDVDPEIVRLLEYARKYSETFYSDNVKRYQKIAEEISKEIGVESKYLLMMTKDELLEYVDKKISPSEKVLANRYSSFAMYCCDGKTYFLRSDEADELEEFWKKQHKNNELKGVAAYHGFVKGKVRVVSNFRGVSLKQGKILVTGMTDPNFVPLIKNAAAIITDGGGLLCHAAIVARELKKPCIIGTKIATKVLKDGDMVEVDAEKGIVRIIK